MGRCSSLYWFFYWINVVPLLILSYIGYHHVLNQQRNDPGSVMQGDLLFNDLTYAHLLFAVLVGLFSGVRLQAFPFSVLLSFFFLSFLILLFISLSHRL